MKFIVKHMHSIQFINIELLLTIVSKIILKQLKEDRI